MQKYFYQLNERDRRISRKWWLASVGFYGSILAGLILYAVFHENPEVNYASADPAIQTSDVSVAGR